MKKLLIATLLIALVISTVSGLTMMAQADNVDSVSIDDYNRVIVNADASDYVCFAAQYDKDMKLIAIDYSYLYSFKPDIDESAAVIKAFVWDSMDSMNNLATPATKNVDISKHLSIKFSDIREMETGSARSIIRYWTDKNSNKTNTIRIKNDATYTINGVSKSTYNNELLAEFVELESLYCSADDAQIDFYCSAASDAYDYDSVEITIYENFVVDSYDSLSGKIYANMDSASALSHINMYSVDYITTIKDVYGNTVSPSQLENYDILSMCVTPYNWTSLSDITNIDATLSRNTITGVVTEINSRDNEVYINGKLYAIDSMSPYLPILDVEGTFCFDFNGVLVAYNRTSPKNISYAVIVNATENSGDDNIYQVEMYTADGDLEVRTLAAKVKSPIYNGYETITSSCEDKDMFSALPALPAVCSYKLNTAGEISSLSFAANEYNVTSASVISSALVANALDEVGDVRVEGKEIKRIKAGATYYINNDTKIIAVDSDSTTDDGFAIYTAEQLVADQEFDSVSIYDTDDNNYAGLIYIYDDNIELKTTPSTPTTPSEPAADDIPFEMVKQRNWINDSLGNPAHKITTADYQTYTTYKETAVDLSAGEIIVPTTIADGYVDNFVTVTEADETGTFKITEEFLNYYKDLCDSDLGVTYYYGKVDYKQGNTVYFTNLLKYENGAFVTEEESIILENNSYVSVFDASRASSNKVTYEGAAYMSFATKPDVNGKYPITDENIGSYFILVREFNGAIQDVAYYCYTTDVDPQTIN